MLQVMFSHVSNVAHYILLQAMPCLYVASLHMCQMLCTDWYLYVVSNGFELASNVHIKWLCIKWVKSLHNVSLLLAGLCEIAQLFFVCALLRRD